ncbi:hypothetical protein VDP57_07430 [Xanthomonas campestris pv. campestris]|uniref:hypothetical protein n=1 Tax=Xanthomonas campestris TaxID=339 RepID=UPI00226A6852|nr:hypothetical protein [Xanthomonas campestris]MEB1347205.1 hypothetical protein [Xanthomonas campestris pv. campestris]
MSKVVRVSSGLASCFHRLSLERCASCGQCLPFERHRAQCRGDQRALRPAIALQQVRFGDRGQQFVGGQCGVGQHRVEHADVVGSQWFRRRVQQAAAALVGGKGDRQPMLTELPVAPVLQARTQRIQLLLLALLATTGQHRGEGDGQRPSQHPCGHAGS